ncbi:hypothetical protein [Bisgaardia hudsonensis]|uniref:hypothetical protein n=1 Tax=Bisgaardia hudsonensis TaxID=109472 RepID=UPI0014049023|nr:hypothetical protein [Bisgaardia hudsonensis]
MSDHTRAYIRDERAVEFLFSGSDRVGTVKSYHQDRWGRFEPKIKTIQFNNHKVEDQ